MSDLVTGRPSLVAYLLRDPNGRPQVLELALERTDLSPGELACSFADEKGYFVSESSVYRLLNRGGFRIVERETGIEPATLSLGN